MNFVYEECDLWEEYLHPEEVAAVEISQTLIDHFKTRGFNKARYLAISV